MSVLCSKILGFTCLAILTTNFEPSWCASERFVRLVKRSSSIFERGVSVPLLSISQTLGYVTSFWVVGRGTQLALAEEEWVK